MNYLIAYDIADPRRLQRVARRMERHALRCQKSVFLFQGDQAAIEALLELVTPLLDLQQDIVQAWKLGQDQDRLGLQRGTPLNLYPAGVILGRRQTLFVDDPSS